MTDIDFEELDQAMQAAVNDQPVKSVAMRRGRFMDFVGASSDHSSSNSPKNHVKPFAPVKSKLNVQRITINGTASSTSNASKVIDPSFSPKPQPNFEKPTIKPPKLRKPKVNPFFPNGMPKKDITPAQIHSENEAKSPEHTTELSIDEKASQLISKGEVKSKQDEIIVKSIVMTEPKAKDVIDDYDEDKKLEDELDALIQDANQPDSSLQSPFIPGAKVEKRPLGSPTLYPKAEINKSQEIQPEVETVHDELNNEINGDLMDLSDILPAKKEDVEPLEIEVKNDSSEKSDLSQVEKGQTSTTPKVPVFAQSKSQEFNEDLEPAPTISGEAEKVVKSSDQPSVSIYDTENYMTPVADEKPVSFKWALVLFIIAIILGIVAGAAYFLFNNQ